MRTPRNLGKGAALVSLAAVTIAIGACSGDGDGSEDPARSASVGQTVTPIKKVSCGGKTYTQRYFGELYVRVSAASSKKLWLMSSDVDCGGWSGKSNPTQLAQVGPYESGRAFGPGVTNPFRLEVTSSGRPQWRMRMVTKAADGTFKELYSFKVTFAPFPKRSAYRGLFLCPHNNCNDITKVRQCPSRDPKNIDCGFPGEGPRQVTKTPIRDVWFATSVEYRTPAFGGFKPFAIDTWSWDDPGVGEGRFEIHVSEVGTGAQW